jgi:hypothetical protein
VGAERLRLDQDRGEVQVGGLGMVALQQLDLRNLVANDLLDPLRVLLASVRVTQQDALGRRLDADLGVVRSVRNAWA